MDTYCKGELDGAPYLYNLAASTVPLKEVTVECMRHSGSLRPQRAVAAGCSGSEAACRRPFARTEMTTFTEDDENKLIQLVAGHPVLYDASNPNYRNNLIKDSVWKALGKDLNKNSEACKKKWKSVRDGYHRFKKTHQLGACIPKQSKDKRHMLLSFLDCDPLLKSGDSNTPSSSRDTNNINEEDSTDDSLCSNEQEIFKSEVTSDAEVDSDYADIIKFEVEEDGVNEQNTTLVVDKRGLNEDGNLKVRKDRGEKRQNLIRSTMKKKNDEDDINLFIRHIGVVLRNLPPVEKAQAKKDLYAVLSDYEIMAAKNSTGTASVSTSK